MSVGRLCQICEEARAENQCQRCGTLACRAHYDAERGMCTSCARTIRDPRGNE